MQALARYPRHRRLQFTVALLEGPLKLLIFCVPRQLPAAARMVRFRELLTDRSRYADRAVAGGRGVHRRLLRL